VAGIYTDPLSRIPTGYRMPAMPPGAALPWTLERPVFPPGPGWVQQVGVPQDGMLAGPRGLRGVGEVASEDAALSTAAYAALSTVGAAAGGALLGFVSSGHRDGAQTGAAFSAGVSALADAVLFAREGQQGATAAMALLGLGALSWSLYRFHGTVAARR
jgi:hypothetical protein